MLQAEWQVKTMGEKVVPVPGPTFPAFLHLPTSILHSFVNVRVTVKHPQQTVAFQILIL